MFQEAEGRKSRISRPALLALLAAIVFILAASLVLWRGARSGVSVIARSPAENAGGAPGLAAIRVRFDRPMDTATLPKIRLTPAVTGTLRWVDDATLSFRPSTPLLPQTAYTVEVEAGAGSQDGRALNRAQSWRFTTRPLRILFLGWDDEDRVQLYAVAQQGGEPLALSRAPRRVLDYALSPDGETVIYSSERQDGGSDLWQAPAEGPSADGASADGASAGGAEPSLLLDCGGDFCIGPSWAPDGERLLYERRAIAEPGETPGPPRLWWLIPTTGESTPLFGDEQILGHAPRFSDDGAWMSYVVPLVRAVQLYNFETGALIEMPNEIGEPAAWHPWRNVLVNNDIRFQGESFSVHLFRLDLPAAEAADLSGQIVTNDGSAAWSPNGEWIAFGRKVPGTAAGRQLWLMRPDGSETRAITGDIQTNFGPPSWSPDGSKLLVQRFDMTDPGGEPGIWVVDVDDGELHQVVEIGFQPEWLP